MYDLKTHKKIEEGFAKGGSVEGREVKTTSRIPDFSVKIGKGDKVGSASLEKLMEWAPATERLARITGRSPDVMAAGVSQQNRKSTSPVKANNVASDLAQ